MTHSRRVRTMARVWIVITLLVMLLYGSTLATNVDVLRMIVTFKHLNLKTSLGNLAARTLVATLGSNVVHDLSFVNALAIRLSTDSLEKLLTSPLSGIYGIEVVDDV